MTEPRCKLFKKEVVSSRNGRSVELVNVVPHDGVYGNGVIVVYETWSVLDTERRRYVSDVEQCSAFFVTFLDELHCIPGLTMQKMLKALSSWNNIGEEGVVVYVYLLVLYLFLVFKELYQI